MAVVTALIKNKVTLCRVESNAGGRSFARNIERLLRAEGSTCTIEPRQTTQNKGTRMTLRAGHVKEFIWFRDDDKMNQDYKLYMQQLCSTFKDVAKNKHDDAADATTMLTELMEEKTYNNWIVSI
jgi:predicted phage terminase large subunit-like protein